MSHLPRWQWQGYPRYHQSRANLLRHLFAVPVFLLGNIAVVAALIARSWTVAVIAMAAMLVSLAVQGRGHRTEPVPPEPVTGPANAVARILLEQWVTFARLVLSGAWAGALRTASRRS